MLLIHGSLCIVNLDDKIDKIVKGFGWLEDHQKPNLFLDLVIEAIPEHRNEGIAPHI